MKKTKPLNFLHEMICKATGVSPKLAPTIERLMREDIFHSTLDWQTAEELENGAREAYELYRLAKPYYDMWSALLGAVYKRMTADQRLANAHKRGKPEAIAKAEEHLRWCKYREEWLGTLCTGLADRFFGERA
jgi:hypothetical protein